MLLCLENGQMDENEHPITRYRRTRMAQLDAIKCARVRAAQCYNCPKCNVGIGEECISARGKRMARYTHPGRGSRAVEELSAYDQLCLRIWLLKYSNLLTGNDDQIT